MPKLACGSRCALFALAVFTIVGCKEPPKVFRDIGVSLSQGLLSHDLNLTNKHLKRLNTVDLKLTVYTESEVKTFERHWGDWAPGEVKVVNFPASGGRVQRLTFSGTATLGAETTPVTIQEGYTWKYPSTP